MNTNWLVVVGTIGVVACGAADATPRESSEAELRGDAAGACQSWTLNRKIRKNECVQDAECHWNQCLGNDQWGGFSNAVCAPLEPWQSPSCSETFANAACPFYVPAVGDNDEPGYCDAANPHGTEPASSTSGTTVTSDAVCISALNPTATIRAYDCFEHGDTWWQCRPDAEWEPATLEASGKVYGPLRAPGAAVAGCAVTHRH